MVTLSALIKQHNTEGGILLFTLSNHSSGLMCAHVPIDTSCQLMFCYITWSWVSETCGASLSCSHPIKNIYDPSWSFLLDCGLRFHPARRSHWYTVVVSKKKLKGIENCSCTVWKDVSCRSSVVWSFNNRYTLSISISHSLQKYLVLSKLNKQCRPILYGSFLCLFSVRATTHISFVQISKTW